MNINNFVKSNLPSLLPVTIVLVSFSRFLALFVSGLLSRRVA